ncbi:MAG: hypothetical protein NT157_05830 [Candidatus Micrarchaeota archaeon]|nr:hypothetical protein [Candidatus Micrarchaeota archaeon]
MHASARIGAYGSHRVNVGPNAFSRHQVAMVSRVLEPSRRAVFESALLGHGRELVNKQPAPPIVCPISASKKVSTVIGTLEMQERQSLLKATGRLAKTTNVFNAISKGVAGVSFAAFMVAAFYTEGVFLSPFMESSSTTTTITFPSTAIEVGISAAALALLSFLAISFTDYAAGKAKNLLNSMREFVPVAK